LPFHSVGEIIELTGEACDYERYDIDDPKRWMLVQSTEYLTAPAGGNTEYCATVVPKHFIGFEAIPGNGCEPANFGLCLYPGFTELGGRRRRTNLSGWRWSSFCKTQYASGPEYGGVENFLRCHLSIVKLLDHADSIGLLNDVGDEGGYWDNRNIEALAEEVGDWNAMIAGSVGRLKDMFGGEIEAPILQRQDFEHLEAKGRAGE